MARIITKAGLNFRVGEMSVLTRVLIRWFGVSVIRGSKVSGCRVTGCLCYFQHYFAVLIARIFKSSRVVTQITISGLTPLLLLRST